MKNAFGFTRGMNQDVSKDKYQPGQYYYMHNFRVLTNEGLTSGSIESEKGNVLSFTLPDLPEMTLDNGDVIPAQSGLKINGWGNINDTIVVFSTNETSTTPNSYGQIWKLTWDESTGTVAGLTGNQLDPSVHLVYNNKLNFSTYYRIGRVIGRYETSTIQRIYWTDNFNSLRTINIASPDAINVDVDNIDVVPGVDFAQPEIISVGNGNIPVASVVQYAYQLLDINGVQTLVSPTSVLYPLTQPDINTVSFNDMGGVAIGTDTNRSVTYTIKGLDTDFQVIQHIAIIYQTLDVPQIVMFKEEQIPASGEVTVTHTGDEDYINISLVDFNILSTGFDRCKDIEVRANRLITANTKTTQFDLDFDARAYRFNSGRIALLEDHETGSISIDGTAPDYTIVPEDHDCINPYNKEDNSNWATLLQYKYQADGATLGGEGPNIRYEFIRESLKGDEKIPRDSSSDHIDISRWPSAVSGTNLFVTNPDGSQQSAQRANQFKNFAAPYAHAYLKGHARGEVYRYGIVFYSQKGSQSFVKWIGDIKMPEPKDGFPIGDVTSASTIDLFPLGIKFYVDVSSIADQISGYSIVRVKREESDKTRLGTGALMLFDIQDSSYSSSLYTILSSGNDPVTDDTIINGVTDNSNYHLNDKPGFSNIHLSSPSTRQITHLISPLGLFSGDRFSIAQGDFIKTYGYYDSYPVAYYLDTINDRFAFHYKTRTFRNYSHAAEYFEINSGKILDAGEYIPSNTGILNPQPGDVNNLINMSYSRESGTDQEIPLGAGDRKLALILDLTPTIANGTSPASMGWTDSGLNGDYTGLTFTGGVGDQNTTFKEVAYCRYVANQYGGNTYEQRSQNKYMSTGHYQSVNDITGSNHAFHVFGGDVFVNYYDEEYMKMYYSKNGDAIGGNYDDPGDNKLSVAVCMPCETPVNTNYRQVGTTWSTIRDGGTPASFILPLFKLFNPVYRQENTVVEKYFAKDFLSNFVEEQPTRIWASEKKINGELIDNWRIFKANNSIEVDGIYGPINRIIAFKDTLYYFQDGAFGAASIEDRSTIIDESGQQIVLGDGGVLDFYRYVSITAGSYHQFSVVATDQAIYFYDTRLKKFYKYSNAGTAPLSDMKGMSSFFDKNIKGSFVNTDKTTSNIGLGPIGVHAIPDYRYNRVLFTFLNAYPLKDTSNRTGRPVTFNVGDVVLSGDTYYEVVTGFSLSANSSISVEDNINFRPVVDQNRVNFTIAYNEFTDVFEAFYGYKPKLYYNYGRRLLSVNPANDNSVYEHNIGEYCTYYDNDPEESRVILAISPNASIAKIFNNIEFNSEVRLDDVDIYNETINEYELFNDYQTTGVIPLIVNDNIRRTIREWRFNVDRDERDGKSRIRSQYCFLMLKYTNNNNKRFVLHDVIVSFTPASF